MTLDKLIDKLKDIDRRLFDKFGHLYYASLAYLGIKALDITSTSLYFHKQNNLNAEANDFTRYLMEQFGSLFRRLWTKIAIPKSHDITRRWVFSRVYQSDSLLSFGAIGTPHHIIRAATINAFGSFCLPPP